MGGGGEAALQGDAADGVAAVADAFPCVFEAALHDVLVRALPGGGLEEASEVVFAEACFAGEVGEGERFTEVGVYPFAKTAQACGIETAAHGGRCPADVAVVAHEVLEEEGGAAADLQVIGGVAPVAVEEKMAVEGGDVRVVREDFGVQLDARRVFVPELFGDGVEVLRAVVEVDEVQFAADVPRRWPVGWQQAEASGGAAALAAMRVLVIGVVAAPGVEAQDGVVVADVHLRVAVRPRCQLQAVGEGVAVVESSALLQVVADGGVGHGAIGDKRGARGGKRVRGAAMIMARVLACQKE